ncbi:MAG: hypothetical protein IJC86_01880 [Clostridia bacterium]|nr:hypothetical protein [Clostridia bacterium]
MLTVLTVEEKISEKIPQRLRGFLCRNTLTAEVVFVWDTEVKLINYINRSGKVNWKKISRVAGEGRGNLIYCASELPDEKQGIGVFSADDFRGRLCANAGIEIIRRMPEVPRALRVGVYDPIGDASDLSEHLLRFTDNLVVVTKNVGFYSQQASRLLSDMGAVLCLSRNPSALSSCALVIAPSVISAPFTPMSKSVVLTCAPARVPLSCAVYSRYQVKLSPKLQQISDRGIESDVLSAGLYSLCGKYELGSAVPLRCISQGDAQSVDSLSKCLLERFRT